MMISVIELGINLIYEMVKKFVCVLGVFIDELLVEVIE